MGDILKFVVILHEQSCDHLTKNSNKMILQDIYLNLSDQWTKANTLLTSLIINKKCRIVTKLNKIWNKAIIYSEVKGKRNTKEIYMDKLFDILNWECPI